VTIKKLTRGNPTMAGKFADLNTAPCFEIALCTPDVPAALARAVTAGAKPMRPVEVMPWGQTIAYVADINGFLVELCTPMA
jgi:lactoylglutathione lyase